MQLMKWKIKILTVIFVYPFLGSSQSVEQSSRDTIYLRLNKNAHYGSIGYKQKMSTNDYLYNQNMSNQVTPFTDEIFIKSDSAHFNGTIIILDTANISTYHNYEFQWRFRVIDGRTVKVIGIKNGKRDTYISIDSLINPRIKGIYRYDRNGDVVNERHYKNGLQHGKFLSYEISNSGDSLLFETIYESDSLIDILNNNIVFLDSNGAICSKEDFIQTLQILKWRKGYLGWGIDFLTTKEKELIPEYDIILYLDLLPKRYDLSRKRDRKKVIKQIKKLHTTKNKRH